MLSGISILGNYKAIPQGLHMDLLRPRRPVIQAVWWDEGVFDWSTAGCTEQDLSQRPTSCRCTRDTRELKACKCGVEVKLSPHARDP